MPKGKPELVQVTVRLFDDDLAQIQKDAEDERRPWQQRLREIVHEAVVRHRKAVIR